MINNCSMGNAPEVSPVSIDAIRGNDAKNQQETAPEQQTLNDKRVLEFLHGKVILQNFEKLFSLDMAKQLTAGGGTATEQMISGKLADASGILDKYGLANLKLESEASVLHQALENAKTPPTNMRTDEAARVMHAFEYFRTIKFHCKKLLHAEDVLSNSRKAEYVQSKGLMDGVRDSLGAARENWDKLSTGQKGLMLGAALLGGVLFFSSENATIGKIKKALLTGAKIAGGAWLLDKAVYLFTGESLYDKITGKTPSQKNAVFMKEAYNTDDKGAELMSKAFVQIGELSFIELLDSLKRILRMVSAKISMEREWRRPKPIKPWKYLLIVLDLRT